MEELQSIKFTDAWSMMFRKFVFDTLKLKGPHVGMLSFNEQQRHTEMGKTSLLSRSQCQGG